MYRRWYERRRSLKPKIGKEKYVLVWNAGICPIAKILLKIASPRKIPLKSVNQLLNYGQKRLLKRRTSAILNFKKFKFGHLAVTEFQMCRCVPNFVKIGWFFLLRYIDLTICNMADVRHLEFSKFRVCHLYRHVILLPCVKFHWNRAIDCWVMAKIDFWYGNRPPSWILKIIFGHVTVIEFQMCCCVPNFIKIWCFFRTDNYRDFTIFKMADVRHLKFYGSNNGFLEKPM